VPEYDAFGREVDEDPVAKLRQATVEPVAAPLAEAGARAETEPEPEPEFVPPVRASPQFVRPPRRRHRGLAAFLVLIAVVALLGWAANVVVVSVDGRIDGIVNGPELEAPTGLEAASLIRRANFADAVATLRESGLGRPLTLSVRPDRIDATLVGDDGRMHQVQVDAEGELRELGSGSGPGPDRPTTAYRRIDPSAPERLVRAGAERAGVRARRIDYVVLNGGRPLTWGAYFKGGKSVIGDARGRPQRVL
jgi:hypothetical protein